MNDRYSRSCSTLPRSSNKSRNGTPQHDLKRNSTSYHRLERHPSQANMWSTTVPQSLVNQKLGSRHAPTRSSLRHSRMLVLSKSGAVPRKYLPPVVEPLYLGTSLVTIQFVIGLLLTGMAGWLLIWSPHLAAQDAPHYSGLTFLMSGWIGIMLVTCCRHHYPGTRQTGCVFPVKTHHIVVNIVVSLLSTICGLFAFIFHGLHFYALLETTDRCQEYPLPVSAPEWFTHLVDLTRDRPVSCRCSNSLSSFAFGSILEYPGLPCEDVVHVLPVLLASSCVFNLVASFSALWFSILLIKSRKKQPLTRDQQRA